MKYSMHIFGREMQCYDGIIVADVAPLPDAGVIDGWLLTGERPTPAGWRVQAPELCIDTGNADAENRRLEAVRELLVCRLCVEFVGGPDTLRRPKDGWGSLSEGWISDDMDAVAASYRCECDMSVRWLADSLDVQMQLRKFRQYEQEMLGGLGIPREEAVHVADELDRIAAQTRIKDGDILAVETEAGARGLFEIKRLSSFGRAAGNIVLCGGTRLALGDRLVRRVTDGGDSMENVVATVSWAVGVDSL